MPINVYLLNMIDIDKSEKIVIAEKDLKEYLAKGYIDEAAWKALCAQRAAEAHQVWLTSSDTLTERYQMLRMARDAKLSETDYLMASDYPLPEEDRAKVIAYRQLLRDLPAQPGAPWDGGGELTPWPVLVQ